MALATRLWVALKAHTHTHAWPQLIRKTGTVAAAGPRGQWRQQSRLRQRSSLQEEPEAAAARWQEDQRGG